MCDTEIPIQQLQTLLESDEIEEGPTNIDIDVNITEFSEGNVASILSVVNTHPAYFNDFEVTIQAPDIAEHPIILLGDGLEKSERGFELLTEYLEGNEAETSQWGVLTSEMIEIGEMSGLAASLFEWQEDHPFNFHLDCMVAKSEIGESFIDELDSDLPIALSIWSQQDKLESWVTARRTSYRQIKESIFPDDELPVFVFFVNSGWSNEGVIRFYSVQQFLDLDPDTFGPLIRQYLDWYSRDRELVAGGPNLPIISPAMFESPELRELFDVLFLYSVFAVVSEQIHRTGDFIEFQIASRRGRISDRFSDEEFASLADGYETEELTNLYGLYKRFIEKGTRETYRKLWHRSITDECTTIQDLALHVSGIIRTYEFLEEEAIETNFEDLSDAIQDAHTFTADVTSTISERTTGLTSEIQKVVLTLLGAVFANVFLVIRWSNVDMVLPFSIFVIAGILGFYFPTIQTRVNELGDIIQESDADFEVYSETIQEFSNHLFDFSRFEDRRDSYRCYAQRRKSWTVDKLKIIFTLLTLVWIAFSIVSILGFALLSRQFIVATASLLPAVLIIHYHKELEYYPASFVPFLYRGPAPMTVLVVVTIIAVILKLIIYGARIQIF